MPFRKRKHLAVTSVLPVLDRLDLEAVFCFSIDKLTNIPGAVFQVDRDSDRAILELGRAGNDLDLATLQSFLGNSGASIAIIYDKSGKNNHVTNPNKSTQPRIAEAGIINLANGKPSLRFHDGQYLNFPAGSFTGMSSASMTAVFRQTSGVSGIVKISGSYFENHLSWDDGKAYVGFFSNTRYSFAGYLKTPNLTVHTTQNTGNPGQLTLYKNGRLVVCDSIPTNDFINNPATQRIGAIFGDVDISEMTIFTSALLTNKRHAFEDNRTAYYAIADYVAPPLNTNSGTLLASDVGYVGLNLDLAAYATGNNNFTQGPSSIPGGITFTSTNPDGSTLGQNITGNIYDLGNNGQIDSVPVFAGLDSNTGYMQFSFAAPVAQFGAYVNYDPDATAPTISTFDAAGNLLSSFDLASTPAGAISTPGATNQFVFRGISENTAVISFVRFSGAYIVVASHS